MASVSSANPCVRKKLVALQQKLAKTTPVVMDGRDIGTVVLPDAECKIYLTASTHERALRRYKELVEKGEQCTYESVLADIKERDNNDSTRAVAPAIPAEDAIFLDNSDIDQEETVEKVLEIIESNARK
jgi:cytidylate kinase